MVLNVCYSLHMDALQLVRTLSVLHTVKAHIGFV